MSTRFERREILLEGARIAYCTAGSGPPVVCAHGYPTSSYLWRKIAPALATVATVIAPDFPGFGDSELGALQGTWEDQVAFLEAFVSAVGLERTDLVVHDWGGLIGLRWACDFPARLDRLVITDTGFFPEGRWHDLAKIMRTPGGGERLMEALTPGGFANMLRAACPATDDNAIAEYWKGLATPERRAAKLALYRSGDFTKLEPYRGRLGALARPTLIVWGAEDRFAPPSGARRFAKEIPGAEMEILTGVGHFLPEEAAPRIGPRIRDFLRR